jgi:hypothetical protein
MLLSWAFAVHAMIPAKRRVPIFLSVFFIIIGVFSAKLVKTKGFSSFFMFALVEIWYFARQSTIFTLALLLEDRLCLGKTATDAGTRAEISLLNLSRVTRKKI